MVHLKGIFGGMCAIPTVSCAMSGVNGAIAVWEVERVRSFLGSWRGAIAVWEVEGCDLSFSVSSVSLWFVKKGCLGKLKGCDSEALLQAVRC